MTGFNEEFSRIAKNFKDLADFSINGIAKLLNLGATGIQIGQAGLSVVYCGLTIFAHTAFVPLLFSGIGNFVLALANSDSILTKFAIRLVGNFSYRTLSVLEHLPLVGTLFSKAVLPYAVPGVIGVLFISNLYQVYNEQNKVIRQQVTQLEQQAKEQPDNLELNRQVAEIKNSALAYLIFYATTVAKTGLTEANKSFPMRFVLSMGVPAFAFFFSCLCKVQPGIALANAVTLSWLGYALPYGLIGALGAAHNLKEKFKEIFDPIDHNKARAERAEREKQQALEEEQRLDTRGDRGYRLTDEPNLGQFTNNPNLDPQNTNAAAQKEAERVEKRRLALEAIDRRHPSPERGQRDVAQDVLSPRPVPVIMTPVSARVEPSMANTGQKPDNTATANKGNNKPSFD